MGIARRIRGAQIDQVPGEWRTRDLNLAIRGSLKISRFKIGFKSHRKVSPCLSASSPLDCVWNELATVSEAPQRTNLNSGNLLSKNTSNADEREDEANSVAKAISGNRFTGAWPHKAAAIYGNVPRGIFSTGVHSESTAKGRETEGNRTTNGVVELLSTALFGSEPS